MIGYFFTPAAIGGTLAVSLAIVAMVVKACPYGRAWLTEKFGEQWEEKIWIRFFGWPLITLGFLMWFPDHIWMDAVKLAGGFLVFVLVYVYRRNLKKRKLRESADLTEGNVSNV